MEITEEKSSSAYHIYLYRALRQAVEEWEHVNEDIGRYPPLTEDTATPELTELYHSLEQKRATVLILAATCVEALGNLYLAMKATPEQFEVLERASLIDKWVVLPGLFIKNYTFPKDSQLYADLKRVQQRRNALVHLKEQVTEGERIIHEGKLPATAPDEKGFVRRCAELPIELVKHVGWLDLSTNDVEHLKFTLSFASVWPKIWGDTENKDTRGGA